MQNGLIVKQNFPSSWNRSYSSGVTIRTRIRNCEKCPEYVDETSDIWRATTSQTTVFEVNIIESNKLPQKHFGDMLAF